MTGKARQATNGTSMHFKSATKHVSEVFQSLRIDTNNVHIIDQQAQSLQQQQPPLQQPVEQQQALESLQKGSQGKSNNKNYGSKSDTLPKDEERIPFARSIHQIIKGIHHNAVYTPPKYSPRRKLEPESLLPTPANSPCYSSHHSTMFWFSNEEPEHVQSIFSFYFKILKLDKCSTKFIGRIKRMCMTNECIEDIRNTSLTSEYLGQLDELYTLDELSVFYRDLVPYGSIIPFCTKKYCITSWSLDGLPQTIDLIEDMAKVKALLDKSSYANHCQVVSYLFCLPIFNSNEFTYFCSCSDQQVTFSDKQCCCLANVQVKKQPEKRDDMIQEEQEEDYDSCSLLVNPDKDAVIKEEATTTTEDYMIGLLSPISPLGFSMDSFGNIDVESEQTSDNDEMEEEQEEEELKDQHKCNGGELNMEPESTDRSDADTEQTSDENEIEGECNISEEEADEEDGECDEDGESDEESDEEDDSISFRKKWRR
jgi:hypothetical protein